MAIMNPLQHLLNLLEEVSNSNDIKAYLGTKKENYYLDLEHPVVSAASYYGSSVLFNNKGRMDFEAKQNLHRAGYPVVLVEGSESGWLIVGIYVVGHGLVLCYNEVLLGEEN